ncbi:hypothetical protein GP486_001458 [Trichoglossum hirsutum]|uniref:Uncharacterized protein n=1 Tax=Trichoglossum hirsutum TaxID=265104 RepID=A0A9P8LGM1_9PEZI|nr:hypothetical protein GP486_001458 [Trichoglossum hirsutum]
MEVPRRGRGKAMAVDAEEINLYEILGVEKSSTKVEIKKAYHKVFSPSALSSHPDKVPEDERPEAEMRFKAVSQAYEILHDDEKRRLYDTHGMSAFDPSRGNGMDGDVDFDDILSHMFGMRMGGQPHPGFGGGPMMPRKGRDEEKKYEVTLEELYKGKTTKFASTKNVICNICKGSGGKEKAKPKTCATCHGRGFTQGLRSVGPGLVTQETVMCSSCKGAGKLFKERDRCRKCKGDRVIEKTNFLEIYIPRGSKQGDRIVLSGEADQEPDQEPGDLVFVLSEIAHERFTRAGPDLTAHLEITLAESLCGFSRVVLKHLDGRGIHINHPRGHILRPSQVLKVPGEGMPIKKSDAKGDLYLIVDVIFPDDGWLKADDDATVMKLNELLPKPKKQISAETVDEVEYEAGASLEEFGANSDDPRGGSGWVDEDEAEDIQCAQQ